MSELPFTPYAERVAAARRQHVEDDLQRGVMRYLGVALPHEAMAWHTPNGGMRSKREGQRLSGLGVLAGIPDVAVCWRGRLLMIELKAPGGSLSAVQRALHRRLIHCGAEVMVCRSLPEVEQGLREATVPLRGSVAA